METLHPSPSDPVKSRSYQRYQSVKTQAVDQLVQSCYFRVGSMLHNVSERTKCPLRVTNLQLSYREQVQCTMGGMRPGITFKKFEQLRLSATYHTQSTRIYATLGLLQLAQAYQYLWIERLKMLIQYIPCLP